ncbi:MAG: glycosyltransferase family 2 protein [Clostridia bacterium]|nr:glycosyltransferase family 2 protein [Clostridia bacterium]
MSVKLSLVVPCYNEEENVENFFRNVTEGLKNYTDSYELVFVNDGSRDKTEKKLKKLYEENCDRKITVVSFSRNFGKEAAMYAGLSHAKGEYVTIIDADLQQDVKYVVEMAEILDKDEDTHMVAAFQEKRKEGKFITLCKEEFYKLINKITDVPFVENASDFRIMRRPVVETILSLSEYHRFSKGIFSWVGYNTVSIPYEIKEREAGETKWNFRKLLKYAFEGIMAYTDMPLKLPFYLAAFSLVLGVIMLFAYSVVSGLVLFVGASTLFSLGVIGTYIGKIHTQVKNRPIYIAKEILSYDKHD